MTIDSPERDLTAADIRWDIESLLDGNDVESLLEQADGVEDDAQEALVTQARAVFQQALVCVPGDTEAIAMWSLTDVAFGDPAEGLARLEEALAQEPSAVNLLLVKRCTTYEFFGVSYYEVLENFARFLRHEYIS